MKQESVYLHTVKDMDDAEKIFLRNGIEIVFKNHSCRMFISELTDEERKTLGEQRNPNLSDLTESLESLEKRITESLTILKTVKYDNNQSEQKLDTWINLDNLHSAINIIDEQIRPMTSFRRWRELRRDEEIIRCGVIIGSFNGHSIRFLEFLEDDDPVITISGNNPNPIKESLAPQF